MPWLLNELLHKQCPIPKGCQGFRVGPGVILFQFLGVQTRLGRHGTSFVPSADTSVHFPEATTGAASPAPRDWHMCCPAYLIAMYNPHATAPTSIGGLEDNREAIGVGELVRLMQRIDGGISARDHWNTCWERTGDLCNRLNPYYILSQAPPC